MSKTELLKQNKVFIWILLATVIILLVPLIAMQFTSEVSWDNADFVIMGTLLFSTGSAFVLTARRFYKYKVFLAVAFFIALLYIWAEFAVGIFTNLGS